jgi:hypothetical protein
MNTTIKAPYLFPRVQQQIRDRTSSSWTATYVAVAKNNSTAVARVSNKRDAENATIERRAIMTRSSTASNCCSAIMGAITKHVTTQKRMHRAISCTLFSYVKTTF